MKVWFDSFDGPIGFQFRDLTVSARGDIAHAHSLNHYTGTTVAGAAVDMWVRVTSSYAVIDDTWVLTHEHSSVPFDGATGKAQLEAKP